IDKARRLDGFREKIVRLPTESAQRGVCRIHTSHDDDLRGSWFRNTASQDLEPPDSWQLNVQQYDAEVVFIYLLQCLLTVVRRIEREASMAQERTQTVSSRIIVINNQQVGMSHGVPRDSRLS